MANKIEFGISDLYFGTYTVSDLGVVTLGTPYHQAGAVNLSVESESESNSFYADNVVFWSGFSDNGFSGSIEVAKFDKDVKIDFLGYTELDDGGVAAVKGATKPSVYIMFETQGDEAARRVIMYNCALGSIDREYATVEDSIEPATESMDITVTGDNGTGLTLVSYDKDATGYATLFTNPPVPTLPSA